MIRVNNLTKYYGKHLAVDNISFSVGKGEILGLLGLNAAGKTTTMRILTGFLAPTRGEVWVGGQDMLTQSLAGRRHIGYLPEVIPLYTDMTVRSYLDFLARLRGVAPDKLKKRISQVLEICHLEAYAGVLIGKLSRGYRQRVGIAQAIVHEPQVLILDEPTVGIDPAQVTQTRQLIKELGREHTVILSTHILPEVSTVCERVLIIHQGKIIVEDRIENLSSLMAGSKRVLLEIQGAPQKIVEILRRVNSVTQVRSQGSKYTVEYPGDLDIRSKLTEAIVQEGFSLLSLEPLTLSLEDIFLKLTNTEEAEA